MSPSELLAVLVVFVATPMSWAVGILLWRLSFRLPGNRVIRVQAWASIGFAAVVTAFAATFINNDLNEPPLSVEDTRLLTRSVLLGVSVAVSALWIHLLLLYKDVEPPDPPGS